MVAISSNFGYLLDPGLRKIYSDSYKAIPSMASELFSMQSSTKAVEYDLGVGGMGDWEDFTASQQVSYDDFSQLYRTSYTHREWAKGFKVERKLADDDQYNVINKKPALLATTAKRTREVHAASVFNNAFNTGHTGGDSICLCSASHPYSPSDAGVQSNAGSTSLSATAVEATRLLMRAYTDDKRKKILVQPDMILVPPALEQAGYEIIASKGKVDVATNNANFHYGKYKLVVWDYLTDVTNWFVIDSALMKQYLNWFDRVKPDTLTAKDFDTFISKWAGYMRYSYGWSDWRWIFGSAVTG